MPWLSRIPRLAFACLCLTAAAWVAMPAVQVLFGERGVERVDPPRLPPLERRTSEPPRHVIREESPRETVSAEPAWTSPPPVDVEPPTTAAASPPRAAPLRSEPLPPLPEAFSRRPPAIDVTYRSTVEMPPPPLLDSQAPPPLSVGRPPADARPWEVGPREPAGTPHHYAVRDGDDLTAIAVRFYGNPAAAEAIWSANRDRLPDPKILPIGLVIQLPPRGSAGLPSGQRDRVIEPL